MNYCKNFRVRRRKGQIYYFCVSRKAEIERNECFSCNTKEYKKNAKNTLKTRIKPIAKKRVFVSKETYNKVYERDNGMCRLCGSKNVHLHHIVYRSESKALINEPSNCILLCEEHHRLVHSNKRKYQPMLLEMNK